MILEGAPMKAIKISTRVGEDRTIHLQLPPETPEGLAEVIVLVPDQSQSTHAKVLLGISREWRSANAQRRSQEEIDRTLAEERSGWDS
jgi:hypothetical protein